MKRSKLTAKKKVCKRCQKSKFIWSRGLCKTCAAFTKKPATGPTRQATSSYSTLIVKAQTLFNKLRRMESADTYGECVCFTCKTKLHWKEIHCGHYLHSTFFNARFSRLNTRPQCATCNIEFQGLPEVFREELIREYGESKIAALEQMARRTDSKMSRYELTEMISDLKNQIKTQEHRLKDLDS